MSGDAASFARTADGQLHIQLPEPLLSTKHLSLHRTGDFFLARDEGSRNGTRLGDQPLEKAILATGAVLEAARAFFVYRTCRVELAADEESLGDREVSPATTDDLTPTAHPALERELARLSTVASLRLPVEIFGETGVGKERIAREVHRRSGRPGTLVAVNCGALPENLVEAELFGVKRGAYTGAAEDRPGLLRSADRGTLFLDEVGDLPIAAQVKLLRALQEGEVIPVGSTQPIRVDVRVVSATHRDLPSLVAERLFRADLAARLVGLRVTVLPLRERREDLGLIVASIAARLVSDRAGIALSARAARAIFSHPFPMNIRELQRALELGMALSRGARVELSHLPESFRTLVPPEAAPSSHEATPALSPEEERRKAELALALAEEQGNVASVARRFGKGRQQIHRWMRRFGLRPDPYRDGD